MKYIHIVEVYKIFSFNLHNVWTIRKLCNAVRSLWKTIMCIQLMPQYDKDLSYFFAVFFFFFFP